MARKNAITAGFGGGALALCVSAWIFAPDNSLYLVGLGLCIGAVIILLLGPQVADAGTVAATENLVDADLLPGALIVSGLNGKIELVNTAARKLFSDSFQAGHSHIKDLFNLMHEELEDRSQADQVVDAVLSAPEIQFTEMLYLRDGRAFERITRPEDEGQRRIWLLRDLSHVQMANHDSAMHQSMVEADAARTAELAEQLFHAKAELEAKQAELTRLANTDSLTGLLNRRRFTALGEEAVHAAKDGQEIWVVMMDIDYFKRINDTYGHAAGDVAIRDFARIAEHAISGRGFIGRMGGEEFAAILPGCNLDDAIRVAEAIRRETARHQTVSDTEKFRFTASIGVAQWLPDEITIEAALDRADQALYSAKTYGRNRVVGFEYATV